MSRPSTQDLPDAYERAYMAADRCLARSRAAMPWWFHALMLAAIATTLASVRAQHLAPIAPAALVLLVWLLFMVLRVTVTAEHVHVQLGLFGPKIPIADVVDARVERYAPTRFGGWGIRYALDGTVAYSVPGVGGRGVLIRFAKGGTTRTVFVSSPRPEEIVAAIERAPAPPAAPRSASTPPRRSRRARRRRRTRRRARTPTSPPTPSAIARDAAPDPMR